MTDLKCSEYTTIDEDPISEGPTPLCHCPLCGAFLPSNFPLDKPFSCKKCGAELVCLPDHNEDTKEELEWGKICPISKPKKEMKQ